MNNSNTANLVYVVADENMEHLGIFASERIAIDSIGLTFSESNMTQFTAHKRDEKLTEVIVTSDFGRQTYTITVEPIHTNVEHL